MRIGGFQKVSLMDYPGQVSSIVFTVGCNFRCPFCYVPNLSVPERARELPLIGEEEIFSYLHANRGLIDAVVVSGGEPTVQPDLPAFLRRVKGEGLLAGLESQGTNSAMLELLLKEGIVDYVGMDIKNRLDFPSYNMAAGGKLTEAAFSNIKSSMALLMSSGVEHEFRTTVAKGIHDAPSIAAIAEELARGGEERYFLQNFRAGEGIIGSPSISPAPFTEGEMGLLLEAANGHLHTEAR